MNHTAPQAGVPPLLFESDLAGELEQELLDELQSSYSRVQAIAGEAVLRPSEPPRILPQPAQENPDEQSQPQVWQGPINTAPIIDDMGAVPEQLPSFLVGRVSHIAHGDDQSAQQRISEAPAVDHNLQQMDATRVQAPGESLGSDGGQGQLAQENKPAGRESIALPQDVVAPWDPSPEINVQASIDPTNFAPRRGVDEYEQPRARRWPLVAATIMSVALIGGLAINLLRPGGANEQPLTLVAGGPSKLIYDSIDQGAEIPARSDNSVARVVWDGGEGWPGAVQTLGNPSPQVSSEATNSGDAAIDSRRPTSRSPEQKLVRTVSVLPDGTIVSNAVVDTPIQDVRTDAPSLISVPDAPPSNTQNGFAGEFMVQVLSQRSEEMALASFNEMRSRYPSALGGHVPSIQRADLGERGVYYRVRIGFPSREQATRMCENLKASGGDCFLATL